MSRHSNHVIRRVLNTIMEVQEPVQSENLSKAKSLLSDFSSAKLFLLETPTIFQDKDFSDWDGVPSKDPAAVALDVAAQTVTV